MDRKQLESTFDSQASTYDQQWGKLAAFRDGIHLLLGSLFSSLPPRSVEAIIGSGGFEPPIQFFQAGLIHALYCRRRHSWPLIRRTPSVTRRVGA
jgi:hypothetical protein